MSKQKLPTGRQAEVWEMISEGVTNNVVAERLGLSEKTVKAHVTELFKRTGAYNRTQLAILKYKRDALRYRWLRAQQRFLTDWPPLNGGLSEERLDERIDTLMSNETTNGVSTHGDETEKTAEPV